MVGAVENQVSWLILGSNGQLGRCLQIVLESENIAFQTCPRSVVDITQIESIRNQVQNFRPSVIVNAAAWTDVDGAEAHSDEAFLINGVGAENVAKVASSFGIPLVHISTDYVFDGRSRRPYLIDDSTNPQSIYGKSKLMGEQLTLNAHPNGTWILRTAWLYSPYGKNFARTIIRKSLSGDKLSVVDDVFGQPTNAMELSRQLVNLVRTKSQFGIFHATNGGQASWYEFACELISHLNRDVEIQPVPADTFPSLAPRPTFSVLDHSEWLRAGMKPMTNWRESLREVVPRLIESVETEM